MDTKAILILDIMVSRKMILPSESPPEPRLVKSRLQRDTISTPLNLLKVERTRNYVVIFILQSMHIFL